MRAAQHERVDVRVFCEQLCEIFARGEHRDLVVRPALFCERYEQRTREGAELRARLETQNASTVDAERLLQRVRAMIDQSEQRQQRELALRLSQVSREVDTQHQADLLRIQQDVGQQQEALEYLVRTSGGVK